MLDTTRKWVRQLVDNRSSIHRDLLLGVSYLGDIPALVRPYKGEPAVKSELNWRSYNSASEALVALYQVLIPGGRRSASLGTLVCQPSTTAAKPSATKHGATQHSTDQWFFVNGMATPAPTALLNASELARVFARPIHLLHNPTRSLWRDLADSVAARTLRKDGRLSRPAAYVLQKALEDNDRVVLVCHSQGTIVASYIVRKLLRHASTRALVKKLEIYCIGGMADSLEVDVALSHEAGHAVPYVEHFANGRDYLAEVGVLSHLDFTEGTVFCIPKRSGHLLNLHYLAGIARGDYCQRRSRLYHYVRGKSPSSADYMAFEVAESA